MAQRIDEQIGMLPAIESERHFFAVGLEMLGADFMPRSHDSELEKRERGFDRVGVDVSLRVNLEFVANRLVSAIPAKMFSGSAIRVVIIGEKNFHVFADILADVLF